MDEPSDSIEVREPKDWHKLLGTGAAVASAAAALIAIAISLMPAKNGPPQGAQASTPTQVTPAPAPAPAPAPSSIPKLDEETGNSSATIPTKSAHSTNGQSDAVRWVPPPVVVVPPMIMTQSAPPPTALVGYIAGAGKNQVRVHDAASHDSETIDMLDPGDRVEIVSQPGDWFLVRTPHNKRGFVYRDFMVFSAPPAEDSTSQN